MKNKTRYKQILVGLGLGLMLLSAGCGQNVFKGLTNVETDDTVAQSQSVINSSTATSAQKQQAYIALANAYLDQNGVSLGKVLGKIALLNTGDSVTRNAFQQISSAISITPSSAIQCADALNSAEAYGVNGTATQDIGVTAVTLVPSVNMNIQFNRGFANTMVVLRMISYCLNIDSDGTPTLNAGFTWTDTLTYLAGGSKGVYYYSANALDAFQKSGALTTDQLDILKRVTKVGSQLKTLYQAYQNGTTFVLQNYNNVTVYTSSTFSGLSSSAKETLLETCFVKIFQLGNKN